MSLSMKFKLGRLAAAHTVKEVLQECKVNPTQLLKRHVQGDWGVCSEQDKQANDFAVLNGGRIWSVYPLPQNSSRTTKVWIITEADRSSTCFLLPTDY